MRNKYDLCCFVVRALLTQLCFVLDNFAGIDTKVKTALTKAYNK